MERAGHEAGIGPDHLESPVTATAAAPLAGAPQVADPVAWGAIAILERTGEDHFGDVFRARDPALGLEVTLRLRAAEAARDDVREGRFLDEANRLVRVRHANVLAVHGADRRDGRLGLWADRVAGWTLEQHLLRDGPLPPGEVRRIGLELCKALAAIHEAGIIHREVRTSGVVREEGGRIVLLDSGSLGDLPRRPRANTGVEGAGAADALERALAPEQLRGESVSLSTDVYGLGVLLYRLASGHDPVEAGSTAGPADAPRRRPFVPLRDRRPALPLDLVRVVEKAIDPEPMRRYPNAVALERALASTLMAPIPEPATAAPPDPAPEWLSLEYLARWRTGIFSAAAFAFGCLVAVMLIAEPSPSRNAAPVGEALDSSSPAPDGPPVPAALAGRWHVAPSSAVAEAEEAWAYKPIPKRLPYGPATQRAAHGVTPPAAPPASPRSGAVAGATAMLRVLAQGPGTPAEPATRVNAPATLTLSTLPDEAWVTIDGVRQRQWTNATFRIEPGTHSVLVEKLGYQPQELPRLELVAGQKMRASITLAAAPADSFGRR